MKNLENFEPEDVWLRFFLRRLQFGLRKVKSSEVQAVLQELIDVAQERLDHLECGTDNGHIVD